MQTTRQRLASFSSRLALARIIDNRRLMPGVDRASKRLTEMLHARVAHCYVSCWDASIRVSEPTRVGYVYFSPEDVLVPILYCQYI